MARQKKHNGYFRKTFVFEGKQYYVYSKDPVELLEKVIQKKKDLEEGKQTRQNPTLKQYYDHFSGLRRNEVTESTIRTQKARFGVISDVLIDSIAFGDMRIKDITRRHIETVRQSLLDDGKSPMNLNECFSHLNHVFNQAVIDDTITKNPCKALKPLKRNRDPISETKHRALSEDEVSRFFDVARSRRSYYLNMFLFMINTGVRVGEMSALYPVDIDRKNGFIRIRKTITRNEIGQYIVGETAKTKSGERDIPLNSVVLDIVRNQEAYNRLIHGLTVNGLLFRSVEGDILREYQLNREIARICKEAGVNRFTCHSFRVTFATRFIEQRPHDYKVLSEILGHKDISITLNLYTRVMKENKVNAMKELVIKTS